MNPTKVGVLLLFIIAAPGVAGTAAWQRMSLAGVIVLMALVGVGFLAGGLVVGGLVKDSS